MHRGTIASGRPMLIAHTRRDLINWAALAAAFVTANIAFFPKASNVYSASISCDERATGNLQADDHAMPDETLFAYGKDRRLCPTLVARPCMHRARTHEDSINAVHKCMATVRQTFNRLPAADSRVLILYDLAGAGYKNLDMVFARELVKALEGVPDYLGKVLVFNGHWSLRAAWTAVSPLLHPETRRKVIFCDSNSLLDYVDHDHPYLQHLPVRPRSLNVCA